MKKAKIMLTAITVLAVVGGALAFKAQKFHTHKLYCTNDTLQACTVAANYNSTFTIGAANTTTYCSDISHTDGSLDPCPSTKFTLDAQ